jgi:hypothetical protein
MFESLVEARGSHWRNPGTKKRKADEVEEAEDTPGCLIGNADY